MIYKIIRLDKESDDITVQGFNCYKEAYDLLQDTYSDVCCHDADYGDRPYYVHYGTLHLFRFFHRAFRVFKVCKDWLTMVLWTTSKVVVISHLDTSLIFLFKKEVNDKRL